MTPEEAEAVEDVLAWLYISDDSAWTCPGCSYMNGGAYRLRCKYCNFDNDKHPISGSIETLWQSIGGLVDDDGLVEDDRLKRYAP